MRFLSAYCLFFCFFCVVHASPSLYEEPQMRSRISLPDFCSMFRPYLVREDLRQLADTFIAYETSYDFYQAYRDALAMGIFSSREIPAFFYEHERSLDYMKRYLLLEMMRDHELEYSLLALTYRGISMDSKKVTPEELELHISVVDKHSFGKSMRSLMASLKDKDFNIGLALIDHISWQTREKLFHTQPYMAILNKN